MVTLRLKVSNPNPEQGKFMSVTSDMLEIVPSANGVSTSSHDPAGLDPTVLVLFCGHDISMCTELRSPQPAQNPYGAPPDLSPDDAVIVQNRDQELGMPVGKGDPSQPPILLAKLSKRQEIELVCKAYKVGPPLLNLSCYRLLDLYRNQSQTTAQSAL